VRLKKKHSQKKERKEREKISNPKKLRKERYRGGGDELGSALNALLLDFSRRQEKAWVSKS